MAQIAKISGMLYADVFSRFTFRKHSSRCKTWHSGSVAAVQYLLYWPGTSCRPVLQPWQMILHSTSWKHRVGASFEMVFCSLFLFSFPKRALFHVWVSHPCCRYSPWFHLSFQGSPFAGDRSARCVCFKNGFVSFLN